MNAEHLENLLVAVSNASDVPLVYSAPLVALGEALNVALADEEDEHSPELDALIEAVEAVTEGWTGYPDYEFNPRHALIDGAVVVEMNQALYQYRRAMEKREKAA
jgi:hypothetical protein